jgi:hypothetical protein
MSSSSSITPSTDPPSNWISKATYATWKKRREAISDLLDSANSAAQSAQDANDTHSGHQRAIVSTRRPPVPYSRYRYDVYDDSDADDDEQVTVDSGEEGEVEVEAEGEGEGGEGGDDEKSVPVVESAESTERRIQTMKALLDDHSAGSASAQTTIQTMVDNSTRFTERSETARARAQRYNRALPTDYQISSATIDSMGPEYARVLATLEKPVKSAAFSVAGLSTMSSSEIMALGPAVITQASGSSYGEAAWNFQGSVLDAETKLRSSNKLL